MNVATPTQLRTYNGAGQPKFDHNQFVICKRVDEPVETWKQSESDTIPSIKRKEIQESSGPAAKKIKSASDPKLTISQTVLREPVKELKVVPLQPTTTSPTCFKIASKASMMHVPYGVCGGDHLRLFDVNRIRTVGSCIKIPKDAYDGKMLDCKNPPDGYEIIAGDGESHTVGGKPVNQHAVRLAVHKDVCKDLNCKFMGCKDSNLGIDLFTDVSLADVDQYKTYWNFRRLTGIRKHLIELKKSLSL